MTKTEIFDLGLVRYVTYSDAERELLKRIDGEVARISKEQPHLKMSNDQLRAVYVDAQINNTSCELDHTNDCLHLILEWDPSVCGDEEEDYLLEAVLFKPLKEFITSYGYYFEQFQYLSSEDGSAIMVFNSLIENKIKKSD